MRTPSSVHLSTNIGNNKKPSDDSILIIDENYSSVVKHHSQQDPKPNKLQPQQQIIPKPVDNVAKSNKMKGQVIGDRADVNGMSASIPLKWFFVSRISKDVEVETFKNHV